MFAVVSCYWRQLCIQSMFFAHHTSHHPIIDCTLKREFGHTIIHLYFFWQIQQRKILVGVWSHVCVTKITYSEIFLTNSTKENKRGFVWQKIIYFSDKFNACKCKGKYQSPLQENVCDWLFCGFQAIYNSTTEKICQI